MEEEIRGQLGGNLNFDELPVPEAGLSDLNEDLLKDFVSKVISKKDLGSVLGSEEAVLSEMKIIARAGDKTCPTITGLLLFGKNPQKYLWSSSVKMVRFSGKDKAGHIIEQKELRGTIPQIITEAEHFLVRNMKLYGTVQGLKRTDIPEYPLEALREVIVNALVHRDYSVAGSTCRIYMFDDKIEFYSPGALCHPTNIGNIESTQYLRNKNIVESLFYMGDYLEKLGTGITKIKTSLKEAGLKDPKFIDSGTDFIVIMFGPENRVLQIEKSDRAKKLRRTIGQAKKPEEMGQDSFYDMKKEDREILEEKIRHEKKKEEERIKSKARNKKVAVISILVLSAAFAFVYFSNVNAPDYLIEKASRHHSQRNYQNSSGYYKKFIRKYPKNPAVEDAYYFLGACLEMMGDEAGAIDNYKKVITIFPNGRRKGYSQFWIGKIYAKEKKYADAIEHFRNAIGVYSEKELVVESFENIAGCYKEAGDYAGAIKTYLELLKFNDSISDGHEFFEIACAYEKLGDVDRAREYFVKTTLNKSTALEWLEKSRNKLMVLEGEKYKSEK